MRNFILRRLFLGIFITIFGAMVVYTVIRSLPTSYVEAVARQRASNPLSTKTYQEWLDQLNEVYKLDVGIIPGFIGWMGNAVQGDFGESWHYGVPVTEKFQPGDLVLCHHQYRHVLCGNIYRHTIREPGGTKAI